MAARDFFSRSIFSCFTDKRNTLSAQPASSEKDLTSVNDNSRTFVRETHTVDSRHAGSCSATATPLPNDIQSHGSHPSSRLGASSPQSIAHERGFQIGSSSTTSSLCDTNKLDHAENIHEPAGEQDIANASHVAGLALESSLGTPFSTPNASDNISGTQSHAPSPAPSSSNPSSSVLKESDYTKNINTAVGSVDTSNVDADLNDISDYISQYLAFIQGKMTKPSQTNVAKRDWPGSKCLFKLKEVVGQGGEAVKAVCPDAKTIAQRSLQGLGVMHMLTTGFLVVANIMERYETISHNKEVCLSLLEGMNTLVQYVKQLQERLGLKEGMKTKIEKAIKLIIEVSLACCTQIDKPKYIQFFSTAVNQEEMVDFKKKLTALYNEIHLQMGIHLQDGIEKIDIRLRKEPSYPQYPREACKL